MERPRPEKRSAGDAALHLLRRRPRTRTELSRELEQLGHESAEIDESLSALEASGYVNDAELARHYIRTRAARLGHGRDRLIAELERRGVPRMLAEQAWSEVLESGEVVPLEQLRGAIQRRLQGRRKLDSNGFARVYNALLRAGYDAGEIRRELDPYHAGDPFDTQHDDETHDDFP